MLDGGMVILEAFECSQVRHGASDMVYNQCWDAWEKYYTYQKGQRPTVGEIREKIRDTYHLEDGAYGLDLVAQAIYDLNKERMK